LHNVLVKKVADFAIVSAVDFDLESKNSFFVSAMRVTSGHVITVVSSDHNTQGRVFVGVLLAACDSQEDHVEKCLLLTFAIFLIELFLAPN